GRRRGEAAGMGQRTLEKKEQPFAGVELDAPMDEAGRHGEWQVRESGQPLPGTAHDSVGGTLRLAGAEPVPAFATKRLLKDPSSTDPFLLAEIGRAHV